MGHSMKIYVIGEFYDCESFRQVKRLLAGHDKIFYNVTSIKDKQLVDKIKDAKPDRILILGKTATVTLFPEINHRTLMHGELQPEMWKVRGSIVEYNNDGVLIPCMLTFDHTHAYDKDDKSRILCFEDDIANIISDNLSYVSIDHKPEIIHCKRIEQVQECFALLGDIGTTAVAFDFETVKESDESQYFGFLGRDIINEYTKDVKAALMPYKLLNGLSAKIHSVSFSIYNNNKIITYAIPLTVHLSGGKQQAIEVLKGVAKWAFTPTPYKKIGHNVIFELKLALMTYEQYIGVGIINSYEFTEYEDTMSLAMLMNENNAGLKSAVVRWLGVSKEYGLNSDIVNIAKLDIDEVLNYNGMDAYYSLQLYLNYIHKFKRASELYNIYEHITKPATWALLRTWRKGIPYDVDLCFEIENEFIQKADEAISNCKRITNNNQFNPASSMQESEYYRGLGYEAMGITNTGRYKMDDSVRQYYIEKYNDELAKNVSVYKKSAKLIGTYLSKIAYTSVCVDHRIRPSMSLLASNTGRTSCSMPNIQNFPKHNEDSKQSRLPFRAPNGYKYCSVDLSQIEARLIAVASGDRNFVDAIKNGMDIHKARALRIFKDGLGYSEDDAIKYRQEVKGFTFGVFYGSGANKQAATFRDITGDERITKAFMQEQINDLFDSYPEILAWRKEMAEYELKYGYIRSVTGRRRRSPMTPTQRLSATIQGLGTDMLLSAYIQLHRKLWIVMAIHDDLTFLLKNDDQLDRNIDLIVRCMTCVPWLYFTLCDPSRKFIKGWVPFGAEVSIGDSWYSLKEVKKCNSVQYGGTSLDSCVDVANETIRALHQLPDIRFDN